MTSINLLNGRTLEIRGDRYRIGLDGRRASGELSELSLAVCTLPSGGWVVDRYLLMRGKASLGEIGRTESLQLPECVDRAAITHLIDPEDLYDFGYFRLPKGEDEDDPAELVL